MTVTSKVFDDFGDHHKGQKHGDQGIHPWLDRQSSKHSSHDAKHLNHPVEVIAVEHEYCMDATAINQRVLDKLAVADRS